MKPNNVVLISYEKETLINHSRKYGDTWFCVYIKDFTKSLNPPRYKEINYKNVMEIVIKISEQGVFKLQAEKCIAVQTLMPMVNWIIKESDIILFVALIKGVQYTLILGRGN